MESNAPTPGGSLTLVGLGEALYDVFGDHRELGGAPLNLALAADQLLRPRGGRGVIVSRVGQDEPGDQMRAELRQRGIDTSWLQADPDRPTGQVRVGFDASGEPRYEILPGAWDAIQFDPDVERLAGRCDAVAFGTLAQRGAPSRQAIYRFLDTASSAIRLFDVNLRQNDFDRAILMRSCERATIVKMNRAELPRVAAMLGIEGEADAAAQSLRGRFGLDLVVVTRGAAGVRLYHDGGISDSVADPVDLSGGDAVGAGDACAAGLLVGRMLRRSMQQTADLAHRCGAFVAGQRGATPAFPPELIAAV